MSKYDCDCEVVCEGHCNNFEPKQMKTKTKSEPKKKTESEQALEALQTISKSLQSINFSLASMERRSAKMEGTMLDSLRDAREFMNANPIDPISEIVIKNLIKNFGL